MIDVWNRVMTNIKFALTGVCSNISSSETDAPAAFPTVLVTQTNNREIALDLELSETGVQSEIRVQAFSDKGLADARNILAIACDAMRTMGYRRTWGPREVQNVADRNVRRCEARFRRFVNSQDAIPKFTAETTNTDAGGGNSDVPNTEP